LHQNAIVIYEKYQTIGDINMSWSPIIKEVAVDRPDEGLAGVAREEDKTAASPTRGSFDSGKATGLKVPQFRKTIDTTQTDHLSVPYDSSNS
jgi:hypothetical protein